MQQRLLTKIIRVLPVGIFFAILGFSWAVATVSENRGAQQVSPSAGIRGVGSSTLRISNPQIAGLSTFDLGDACLGSAVLRRVGALGGVQPYIFTSTTIGVSGGLGLTLDSMGRIAGSALPIVKPSPFSVTVTDAGLSTLSGKFLLNTIACNPGDFRFAVDHLPSAQVGMDYVTNIETINEDATTVFSVVPGSVAFNGGAIPSLEFIGLTLFNDGALSGRPLATGTLTFTARAIKAGAFALNRQGTAADQPYSISVAPATSVQSVFATISAKISNSRSNALALQANINLNGFTTPSFANSTFVLRIAGLTFRTTLDAKAQAKSGNLQVSLRPTSGQLKIQLKNQDVLAAIQAATLVDKGQTILVAEVEIGSTYVGTEAIQFNIRNQRGRVALNYQLGRDKQLGGLFQITSLKGRDSSTGVAYDVTYLVSHVKGQTDIPFGKVNFATVRIGPGFVQGLTLVDGHGSFAASGAGVKSFKVDTEKKRGAFVTFPLSLNQTNAQFAQNAAGHTSTFLLGIDFHSGSVQYTGEGSFQIFPMQQLLP